MPERAENFAQLMQRVRDGSEDAAHELWARYGRYVLRVVRRQLQHEIRSKFDSEDFAQQVWGSFFAGRSAGRRFDSPEDLVAFLTSVACNKLTDEYRRYCVLQKRNVNRETSLDGSAAWVVSEMPSDDPTPSKVMAETEEREQFIAQRSVRTATVLSLFLAGQSTEQIAQQMDLNKRTVLRVLKRVAKQSQADRR